MKDLKKLITIACVFFMSNNLFSQNTYTFLESINQNNEYVPYAEDFFDIESYKLNKNKIIGYWESNEFYNLSKESVEKIDEFKSNFDTLILPNNRNLKIDFNRLSKKFIKVKETHKEENHSRQSDRSKISQTIFNNNKTWAIYITQEIGNLVGSQYLKIFKINKCGNWILIKSITIGLV